VSSGTVAAIIDRGGGYRVVVTDAPETLAGHLGDGERLVVVPDMIVGMPVGVSQATHLINSVERHLQKIGVR
jgi:hypothetical protein